MILDCHIHAWVYPDHFPNDVFLKYIRGLLPDITEEEIKRGQDRRAERLLREMDEARVDKALVVGLKSGTTLGMEVPNEFIASEVRPHPERLSWACAVDLTADGAASEAERCVNELGAVALGEIAPAYGHYSANDPRCFPVYEAARSLDVPILMHAGPTPPPNSRLRFGDLQALDDVCVNFPELKIVLCHFGEPYFEEATYLMVKHRNLYADLSLLPWGAGLGSLNPPVVAFPYFQLDRPMLFYFTVPAPRRHKLLWGSDAQNLKESLDSFWGVNGRLESLGLPTIPEDAFQRIFHENWREVFTKIPA